MNFQDSIENLIVNLPDKALELGIRILLALLFLFIGMQVIKIVCKVLKNTMNKSHVDRGVMQFIESFIRASLYIILAFMIASSFGVDAASIVALLGSAGVAIGLAIQGSLSNLAGGVLILLLKPFKVGDYIIESNTNKEGIVDEIQIFYTKLVTVDNSVIVLPNGTLANNSLVNVTASKTRRCQILVGLSYQADIRKAKELILQLLEKDEAVIKENEMVVYVNDLADSYVEMGVRCWFENDEFWKGKWRLTENIKYLLDDANIEIAYPQLDIHIKEKAF